MHHYIFLLGSIILRTVLSAPHYDQKPVYHITPEQGHWINDPNGPIFFGNYWHLFAQYNPSAAVWGNMSWFHWISKDGIFWEGAGVALENDEIYDINGVFSGSAFSMNNSTYIYYTCVDKDDVELQCLAEVDPQPNGLPDPSLKSWTKYSKNPIIDSTDTPAGMDKLQFRDPTVWGEPQVDITYMAMAAELDGVGCIVAYNSQQHSSSNWSYKSVLWNSSNSLSSYSTYMVECPDIFHVYQANNNPSNASYYVLKFSVMEELRELYEIGTFDKENAVFLRDVEAFPNRLEYDCGPNGQFYASKSVLNEVDGKRYLWGWSPEQDAEVEYVDRNWAGVLSMPREMYMPPHADSLRFRPHVGLTALRDMDGYQQWSNVDMTPCRDGDTKILPLSTHNLAYEIKITFEIRGTAQVWCNSGNSDVFGALTVGVRGRTSAEGDVYTSFGVILQNATLSTIINTEHAGGSTPAHNYEHDVYGNAGVLLNRHRNAESGENEVMTVDMNMFFDHSIVEMFALQGASASTVRIYPEAEHNGLSLYSSSTCMGGSAPVVTANMEYWPMGSIWRTSTE